MIKIPESLFRNAMLTIACACTLYLVGSLVVFFVCAAKNKCEIVLDKANGIEYNNPTFKRASLIIYMK